MLLLPERATESAEHDATETDELFDKILSARESIHYNQMFIWARYHEPMAHPSFFDMRK